MGTWQVLLILMLFILPGTLPLFLVYVGLRLILASWIGDNNDADF